MFLYITIIVSVVAIGIAILLSNRTQQNFETVIIPTEDTEPEEHHAVMAGNGPQLKLQSTVKLPYVPPTTQAEQFKQNEAIRNQIVIRGKDQTRYQKAYAHYDRDPRVHGPDDYDAFKEAVLKYAPTPHYVP